ncbi:hypothetical protein RQM59_06575 [Flavobacteriaceae bacterium S356]|uniref:histidine kinase n=1 Tax=Asprobacillus argus TaxID=3076534 RepID=A0ABU3LEN3_9FLAO|nr:hypothetical protein [Flavobacteriaceae bacterium S356]
MKLKKTSLFFCTLLFWQYSIFSQQKIDSLHYYVDLVKTSKDLPNLTKAFLYIENDKEKNLINNKSRAVYDLIYLSRIEQFLGVYYASEASAIEGLILLDSLPSQGYNLLLKAPLLNHLGILKRTLKQYEESLDYYSQTLELVTNKKDSATAYNNVGVAYNYLKEYEKSIIELKRSYGLSLETNDSVLISRSLDNLGYARAMLGQVSGVSDMKTALRIREKINDSDLYNSYAHLIEYYKSQGETKNALLYAKEGYNIAKKLKNLPYKEGVLNYLIDLGDTSYLKEYAEVLKEKNKLSQFNKTLYTSARYNFKREQKRRLIAESNMSEEKSKKILYQVIGGAVVLISILLFFALRARHKKEKLKTQFNTERHISKKLHDEVANDIFSMMSQLQNDPTTKKELIDSLEEVYLKTRDISKANAALDVSKNFDILLKDLIATYKTTDVKIFTRNISEMPWDTIADLKKETLYRVIQELMTNMKKHSRANLVTLQFDVRKNVVLVTYVDNGVGCELNYGNGLRNTENRMELAGGTITFESEVNKGFQAKIIV